MATNTPNYNLQKPAPDEFYNVAVQNKNMDKIDKALEEISKQGDGIIQQDTPPANANVGDLWLDTSDNTYQGTVFEEIKNGIDSHLAEKASLTKDGHVQLNSATNSNDETTAATPKAVKVAYDRADAAFTSASNGKVVVRDAITGKGGTVADSDGDGYPTFQELANGINDLSGPTKIIARSFNDFSATSIDSDDNLYGTQSNQIRKYAPDGTLLWSDSSTDKTITKDGYVHNSTSGLRIYNFGGTLTASTTFRKVGASYRQKGNGNLLTSRLNGSGTSYIIDLYDMNDILVLSKSGFTSVKSRFLNKKDSFVAVNGTGAALGATTEYHIISPSNDITTYSGIGYMSWSLNVTDI
ncbi:tail fiber protein [Bacillus sp. Bva_UNVM-123]|uniref:tail fiber protein n=1 Tax=Bacillus sp. Bva_UNVM-123 TaxID=2829798 RepID=UPI00391F3D1E